MTELPFDLLKANRWFAIECNNQAWDLVEKKHRSPDEVERMIHRAHAARYHWQHAGEELNWLRADVLLATAYCAANRSENALIYAQSAANLVEQAEGITPFDQATISGVTALALNVAGKEPEAKERYGKFVHDLSLIEDPEEKKLLEALYSQSFED